MTTLLLTRHGETAWNSENRWQGHADEPLNEVGRAQARELAPLLVGRGISAVYASDLARAHETAEIAAAPLGLPVRSHPGLREVDVGSWSGYVHGEIEAADPDGFARWQEGGKGWAEGESYEEMGERVVATVLEIAAAHPDETVLVVSHGGSIRACRAAAAGVGYAESKGAGAFGSTRNCEVVELHVVDGCLADRRG
jgi:probable phosphoglycerate mutase